MKPIKAAIISISGTRLTDEEKYLIERENPLGVSLFTRNIKSPRQLLTLTNDIKNIAGRHNVLIAIDQEGGRVCRLAPPHFRKYLAQSAIGALDIEKARQASQLHAELIANDLHKCGINCNFAPTLDVLAPHITLALKSRCFSKNPKIVTELGKIMIDTYYHHSILPCIKHIPGHANAENDPHLQLSVIRKIFERYLYPFEQIAPQALMAMTAHIVLSEIDSLPITMSKKAISKLIRGRFKFKGLLISDALEMKALSGTLQEKTIACRQAGCDAVCYCNGDMIGVQNVLDHCGYLSDTAMAYFDKITTLINRPYSTQNISGKARHYNHLARLTNSVIDDYDAVEVLMKLQKSTE